MPSKSTPKVMVLSRNPTPEERARVGISMPMGDQGNPADQEAKVVDEMRAKIAKGPLRQLREKREAASR